MADEANTHQALPFFTRMLYGASVPLLQTVVLKPALSIQGAVSSSSNQPDLVKKYDCRRRFPIRVFFPPGYDRDEDNTVRLPTLFTIHGGGFILGSPKETDHLNVAYAKEHGLLVISLDYGWAPRNPFPGPIHDVEQLILAALDDQELPVDSARVALMGWSAGGNIALAAAQLESLRDRIRALVPVYPVCDLSLKLEDKLPRRQWKPALGGFRAKPTDFLAPLEQVANWSYIPVGQDHRDPLLNPVFARRESLPRNVFIIACEMDVLAHEGWRLICQLTGRQVGEQVGREDVAERGELILDHEAFHFEDAAVDVDGESNHKWLLIPDTVHGFDHDISRVARDPETMADAGLKTEKATKLIGEWLRARLEPATKVDA